MEENKIDLTRLSFSLVKVFDENSTINKELETNWNCPNTYGLDNSQRVIPEYYINKNKNNKILNIDYFLMIKDDIRNFRKLNTTQMKYIEELDSKHKQELFEEFNNIIDVINDIIK